MIKLKWTTFLFLTLNKIKWGNQLIFHSHISGAVQALYFILCTTRRWYTIKIIQGRTTLRCFQSSWVIIFLLQVPSMSKNFLFALSFVSHHIHTKMVIIFRVLNPSLSQMKSSNFYLSFPMTPRKVMSR